MCRDEEEEEKKKKEKEDEETYVIRLSKPGLSNIKCMWLGR